MKHNVYLLLSDLYVYATNGEVCKHEIIDTFVDNNDLPENLSDALVLMRNFLVSVANIDEQSANRLVVLFDIEFNAVSTILHIP
jgi:hypothetical protein